MNIWILVLYCFYLEVFYAFWMFIWMWVVFILLLWYDEFAWDYVRIMIFVGLWYKL